MKLACYDRKQRLVFKNFSSRVQSAHKPIERTDQIVLGCFNDHDAIGFDGHIRPQGWLLQWKAIVQ
jgi:hypothetical protein